MDSVSALHQSARQREELVLPASPNPLGVDEEKGSRHREFTIDD
jgi:hypothetical protein